MYNEFQVKNILITHSHGDHTGFLPFLYDDDSIIYVPENTEHYYRKYILALMELNY